MTDQWSPQPIPKADDGGSPSSKQTWLIVGGAAVVLAAAVFAIVGGVVSFGAESSDDIASLAEASQTAETTSRSEPDTSAPQETETSALPASSEPATCHQIGGETGFSRVDTVAEVDCTQTHNAYYVGSFTPTADTRLPSSEDEVTELGYEVCRPFVETVDGFDVALSGLNVKFEISGAPGEVIADDILCYVSTGSVDALTGDVREVGLATALAPYQVLGSLNPGQCFERAGDNVGLAIPVDCSATDAWVHIGSTVLDDGPHPEIDDVRALRTSVCPILADNTGVSIAADSSRGVYAGFDDWTYLGRRDMVCVAQPG